MVDFRALPFIGKTSDFVIERRVDAGFLLQRENVEVLLPNKFVTKDMQVGARISVFLYTDSEDRLVATTQKPLAQVGDFAFLRVVDASTHGVFMDWGLDKDLFVPYSEQHEKMRPGESYVVAVFLDNETGRVAAAGRLAEFFDYNLDDIAIDQKVSAVVYNENPRGYQVIVDDRYAGMLYRDQTFARLTIGSKVTGYVDELRPDNKIDLRMRPERATSKKEKNMSAEAIILQALEAAGGTLPLGDKSQPEEIHALLGVSKKAFKAALGSLYKHGKAIPGEHETRSTKKK